ncbi:Outer dense fiber protein 3-like protein 2 [Eumeta japonica]|uniref:Outer dense fiber protein 3-like protein 2 n=1 Tax=Eumeta variegata TaxID=151549 RepID=A0A4C1XYQ5_EUMVA|nr:Outer dense fiber protein 3-like protein 2 [Eumeta japonica]
MAWEGPGPAAYSLPPSVGFANHDPSRPRNPMFSLGPSGRVRFETAGPGPVYRIEGVTQHGSTNTAAWSLGPRIAPRKPSGMPGPGSHAPEHCPQMREQRAPQYTMGPRLGYAPKRPGPAANAYAVQLQPDTPSFSLGPRVRRVDKAMSPGPAVYHPLNVDACKNRAPLFSLGGRLRDRRAAKSPGPAAYPSDLYNTKANSQAYSFGTRHGPRAPPMIVPEDEGGVL